MPLNLPEQPDWEPVPPEEEPTIGAADSRYHVIFSDAPDQATEVERLGLMLTESGPIGFNVQMTSPFSGQLGGPGQREDKDLSRYSVRSQRDWRGGRGQLTTYADTDRFHDSLADTRFPNQVLLPPAKTKAAITSTDPEFTPTVDSTTSQMQVSASWAARARNNQTAHATWTQAASGQGYDAAVTGTRAAYDVPVGFGHPVELQYCVFQKFTPTETVVATTLQFKVSRQGTTAGARVVILSNRTVSGIDRPSTTVLWNHAITSGENTAETATPTWTSYTGDSPYTLNSGTKYWIGVWGERGGVMLGVGAPGISGGELLLTFNNGADWADGSRPAESLLFKVNAGPTVVDGALTRVRLAQKFTAAATNNTTTVQLMLRKVTWGAGSTLSVNIYSDSSGPNAIVGATGTVTMPANTSEQQVTVSMVCGLTSGNTYWLVITPGASTFANNISVELGAATLSPTEAKIATETGGNWGSWSDITTTSFLFYVNYSGGVHDYFYQYVKTITSRAQSFVTPASGTVTPTRVRLRLQRITWSGSPTLTLGLYSNSGGLPGTLLKTATIAKADFDTAGAVTTPNWVEFSPGSPTGLTAATTYWLALVPTAPTVSDFLTIDWQIDTAGNYSGGSSSYQTQVDGSGSWAAGTTGADGYFIINDGTGAASSITIRPVRFSSGWYIAAGLNVYKFNTSANQLDLKYTAAATVTALCSYGGYIYAALGDSNDMVRSADGASWGAVSGKKYTHLLSYNGYMYAAKSVGATDGLAYYNGTVWSPNIVLANASVTVSDLIGFGNELLITATTGLWALSSNLVYQVLDFSNEQYAGNGVNSLTWMADGRVYIPIGQSLHAYDGQRLVPVGLDLEEGLPLDQQGHVSCLVGTRTFLFATVDGGTTSRSGIYAFNGKGWHCLAQASTPGRRIRSLGLEQITSSTSRPRLWYFEDGSPYFLEFPDLTDNPAGYLSIDGTGIAYQPVGYVTSSWIGGELSAVAKDFQSIIVASTGCSTTKTIDLFVEVDRSGIWLPAGTVTRSPLQEYVLLSRSWGPLIVATTTKAGSSTTSVIVVAENTAAVLQTGDFVRIGNEVRQVRSLESQDSFSLLTPLPAAPADGEYVYPARPSGREIRYKAVLNSNVAAATPVLQRISVKMQERLIDKFRFTLTVRLEDGMRLRGSVAAADGYTAAELRAALYRWIKRLSPFYMTDPGGTVYRVKIAYANEGGWTRTTDEGVASWRSQMTIVLDEV